MPSPLKNESQKWVFWFIVATYLIWGIVDVVLLLSDPSNDSISRVHLLLGWQNPFFMPFLMGVLLAHFWWNGRGRAGGLPDEGDFVHEPRRRE